MPETGLGVRGRGAAAAVAAAEPGGAARAGAAPGANAPAAASATAPRTSAPELLPQPWGSVGQALPPGATATLLRSVAFFAGAGAGAAAPLGVLFAWAGAGILLTAAGVFRARSRPAAADRRSTAALAS